MALPGLLCRAGPASGAMNAEPASAAGFEASKKDLLKQMRALEAKLPRGLARQLILNLQEIATGWCSPYLAKEFEAEVDKLADRERKRFEKEWKAVREHEAWPTVIVSRQSASFPPKK